MKLKPCLFYALLKALFLFSSLSAFAQNNNTPPIVFDLKKMKPTSPEAAMLGRFGEVPIGFYNGTANISVPLYTINVGSLQIPITLSYHNSGVKVEDEATWVGLGWSLEPGGAVIKSVVGGDDDLFSNLRDQDPTGYDYMIGRSVTGYFSQSQTVGNTLWNCFPDPCGVNMPAQPGSESQPILVKLLQGDGQPDIFQYSLPNGLSGKFYFNPQTQLPVLINKETELKIIYSKSLERFDLVTLSGDKYTFSALEKSYAGTVTDFTGKTWKLAKITLNDGRIVDFTYTNGMTYQYSWSESYHSTYPWSTASSNSNLFGYNLDVNTSETKYLKQIVAPQVIITFNHEDRQDLPCTNDNDNDNTNGTLSVKRLRSVDITDRATGRLIKSFQFSYSYFGNSIVGGSFRTNTTTQQNEWLSKRLRLDSLREIGYTSTNQPVYQPAYKFDYNNTVLLPLKSSYARDFWGYYNGKNNSRLLPNMYYFYYSNFVEYNNIPASVMNAYSGADRSTDSSKLQAAMLKQITYPTGGFTKFEYEPNEFTNYTYPDLTKLSNLQQSVFVKDQNNSYDTKTTTFTPTTNQTLQFTNVITRGPSSPTQALTFYDLLPSKITLKKIVSGTATTVKEWQMTSLQQPEFNTNGSVTWLNDTVSVIANVAYSISVELPDAVGAQNMAMKQAAVTSSFSYYTQPTGNYTLSCGAGIRLKSMTNYSAPAVLANRKFFKYSLTDGSSSGLLMSPLKFLYWREMLGSFVDGAAYCTTYTALDRVWFISSQSFVPYSSSASGNLVGYSRVEEWDVDAAGIAKGKNIYLYHNQPSDTKINNPDNPDLLNGKMLTQVILNAANDTLQKVNNIYQNLLSTPVSYTGIKLFSNFVNADPCGAGGPHYSGPELPDMGKWDINFYPINSRWYVPVQTTTQTYESGKVARNTKYLVYNQIGQLSKDSTFNSKSQSIVQRYKYPVDINVAQRTLTEQTLIDSSFYDNILEYRTFQNNGETGLTKASYAMVNNRLVRTKIEKSYGGGPLADEALFIAYGTNKNLTEVKDKGGKSHSMVWDRTNSSILAMVENALLKDVAYSSFEVDQPGNWTIGSSSRQQGGYTGKQAYSLTNGTVSRSGLTAGTMYVLTYWTTSGTPLNITGTVGTPSNLAQVNGWRLYQHNITAVSTVTLSGSILIDEVRLSPKDAQMTSYTYEPLIGITSVTDPKGRTSFYEYDDFNRLTNIRDAEGNILKNYCYNYAGQQTGCPITIAPGN